METFKEILTGLHLGGIFALLQMALYTLILFGVAVLSWWIAIVIKDLKKKLLKTGDKEMKAKQLIAYINNRYDAEQEVMGFVLGSEYKEMKADLWRKAVEIWDEEDLLALFKDRIQDIFIDAEIQLYKETRAEEAVDSYLADLAEKELENENA